MHKFASTLTTINDAFTWSQHGTPLSVISTVQPPGSAAVNTTWQPGRPAAAPHSPLPTELNGSLIHWDAFGRFQSHAGIAWERTAFDDRPAHVTVSHDDPLTTGEYEHAVSLRHHAPDGSEVFEQRTEVDGTTAQILRTWVGDRLVRERDDAGWSRTWHQRAHQDVPFAYTIACDGDFDDCATTPAWLGATDVLLSADHRATYALIHNYRGDVVGLVNEAGQLIEQYSYDAHGTLQVRACASTEVCEGAGPCALTTTCGAAVKPGSGEHAGTHGNTLLYAGTHRDPVTGHYRMGARWYDPTLRTFLSRDPAGYAFSFDEWAYTVGDPWNFVDRTGWGPCRELNRRCATYIYESIRAFGRGWQDNGAGLEALLHALRTDPRLVASGLLDALNAKADAYLSAAMAGDAIRFFDMLAWDVYAWVAQGFVEAGYDFAVALGSGDWERIGSATGTLTAETALIVLDILTGGARRAAGGVADAATGAVGAAGAAGAAARRAAPDGGATGPLTPSSAGTSNTPNTSSSTQSVIEYPDGSTRTSDGRFASKSGVQSPGTAAAQNFADHLSAGGLDVVGTELSVNGPLGVRRFDIVVRDAEGNLHGIEVKSGSATPNGYQRFTDSFVNLFGADGTGQIAGETVRSATTVYIPSIW